MEQTVLDRGVEIDPPREAQEIAIPPRATVVRDVPQPPQDSRVAETFHSPEIDQIVGALATAQGQFASIDRTKVAQVESKRTGAKFTYKYEDMADVIEAVRPALSANGLAVVQMPTVGRGVVTITTILAHTSGQWFRGRLALACDSADAQTVGSAISYARRYALKSLLMLAPDDDDDGGRASGAAPKAAPKPAQRASASPEPAPRTVGRIATLTPRGGGVFGKLDTGLGFATRDPDMIASLQKLMEAQSVVDVVVTPSTIDPKKYAPTITELSPVTE
jgi:hypothetical protein